MTPREQAARETLRLEAAERFARGEETRDVSQESRVTELRARGTTVVPHGVSLSLGGAERPDPARLAHLTACATALGSPLVSEHIAFTRAGGMDAGHLLPLPVRGTPSPSSSRTSGSPRSSCRCPSRWRTLPRCCPGPPTN